VARAALQRGAATDELFTASHDPPVERADRAWYHARADLAAFTPIVDFLVRIVTPYVMF